MSSKQNKIIKNKVKDIKMQLHAENKNARVATA